MKRSGFKVQRPPGARLAKVAKQISADYTLQPRPVVRAEPNAGHRHRAVPKDAPLQHEGYMALVRRLPCIRCGVVGFSQFCHADEGKGMGLKTDCRLGWPGCGPRDSDTPGCHWYVGTSGRMGKEARRQFEAMAGRETREAIRSLGQWPATLPAWAEDEALA